ncbi:glycosyltransferase [Caulobacter sp. NIBR2454]|uniref:glycosyltransferase n=1 Tax=Caulobacter sp. NIBR2454 TaxID=3015996 RepID=UPI0022B6F32F|nr:glycosyltransferase [Caulobacter sp. NIBR2454]
MTAGPLSDRPIAFVIFQAGAQADGGLNSISELVAERARDQRVLVFTNLESDFSACWRGFGCDVVVIRMNEGSFHQEGKSGGRLGRALGRVLTNLHLASRLKKERVAVLHANDARSFWSSVGAAKIAGIPIVLNVRDALPPRYKSAPLRWRLAYRLCDLFLVLSQDMEAYWRGLLGVSGSGKVRHLYSIVRTHPDAIKADRQMVRQALGMPREAYVVAYVASFHPKKRQAEFIEHAAGAILARAPEARIIFVGDCVPTENPAAAQAVAAAGRLDAGERLQFVGFSPDPWRWYVAADLIVLASEREGLPRCIIESMCIGAPFASFDVSSAQEMADLHGAASVVRQGDYAALVEAVCAHHTGRMDDLAQRDARGEAARRRFDAAAAREGYGALLEALGAGAGR